MSDSSCPLLYIENATQQGSGSFVTGALSEHLAVIVITGGPNSNDFGTNRILHHTVGDPDFHQELRCFKEVTCAQVGMLTELASKCKPC